MFILISDNYLFNDEGLKCMDIMWIDIGCCSDIVFVVFLILVFIVLNVVFVVLVM